MRTLKKYKVVCLLFLLTITFLMPFVTETGGSVIREKKIAVMAEGVYSTVAPELVGATAYADAQMKIATGGTQAPTTQATQAPSTDESGSTEATEAKTEDPQEILLSNISKIIVNDSNAGVLSDGENAKVQNYTNVSSRVHFGNVGLFLGLKGTGNYSDIWSTYRSDVAFPQSQIQSYDKKTGFAFTQYKLFGSAVQKLTEKTVAGGSGGDTTTMEDTLNYLSNAAIKVANLGTEIMKTYNMAPIVLGLFDYNEIVKANDGSNKLVSMVLDNATMNGVMKTLGQKRGIMSLTQTIAVLLCIFTLLFGCFLHLTNGRNTSLALRKMLVRVLITSSGVYLIALALNKGINFLSTMVDTQLTETNNQSQYLHDNLDVADWYACGFALPSDVTLDFDKDGNFKFSGDAAYKINMNSYRLVYNKDNPSEDEVKSKMQEYYNTYNGRPMAVGFATPVNKSTGKQWKTEKYYAVMEALGENQKLEEVPFIKDDCNGNVNQALFSDGSSGGIGYIMSNGLYMSKKNSPNGNQSPESWQVSMSQSGPNGNTLHYGISPIAAANMMRTDFTGSDMTVFSDGQVATIAFDVTTLDPTANVGSMPAIARFLATFTIMMAAIKGMFQIITSASGSIYSGAFKSAVGSGGAALGEALGGVSALVLGLFGISVILVITYTLLDEVYNILVQLINGYGAGNDDLLQPLADLFDQIPIVGSLLGKALKSLASFILTLMAILTVPKFGGIPVTMWCNFVSELPERFAEKGQEIENKFTGDFRAHPHRSNNALVHQMTNQIMASSQNQMMDMKDGAKMAAGALGGYALSKAGGALANKGESLSQDAANDSEVETNTREESGGTDSFASEAGASESYESENTNNNETGTESETSDREEGESRESHSENAARSGSGETGESVNTGDVNETAEEVNTNSSAQSVSDVDMASEETAVSEEASDINEAEVGDTVNEADVASEVTATEDSDSLAVENSDTETANNTESLNEATATDAAHFESRSMNQRTEMNAPAANPNATSTTGTLSANSAPTGRSMANRSMSGGGRTSGTTSVQRQGGSSRTGGGAAGPRRAAGGGTSSQVGNAARTPQTTRTTSMAGNSPDAARKERQARFLKSMGKGLQAAGGHTTKQQAISGVTAGVAHTAASALGISQLQNATRQHLYSVQNAHTQENMQGQTNPARPTGSVGAPTPNAARQAVSGYDEQNDEYQRRAYEEEQMRQYEEEMARRNE